MLKSSPYLHIKRYFAQNNITVYTINATKIAQEIGLGRSNLFAWLVQEPHQHHPAVGLVPSTRHSLVSRTPPFRITEVIPVKLAVEKMKAAALKSYGAKGQDVVGKNYVAIDRGGEYVQLTVKPEWANLPD